MSISPSPPIAFAIHRQRGAHAACERGSRLLCLGLCLATLLVHACAKAPTSEPLTPDEVKVRVGQIDPVALEAAAKSAPRSLAARTEQLIDAFWQAGCVGGDLETALPGSAGHPDVVCTLRGRTKWRIIVVSHLDVDTEDAASSRWHGVALLPCLYRALSVAPREHTFVFAAFGKSPDRSVRNYLTRLGSPHADDVRAIVDLKEVDPASVWFSSSDAGLRRDFVAASVAVERPLESLRAFPPLADESRAGVAMFTVAAAPPARPGRKLAAVEAAPKRETIGLPATARFAAVFLAYADETLRLRAEALDAPLPSVPDAR